MPDRLWWRALWPDPMATLVSLGIAPGMTVLDLCCGDGYFTAPLAHLVAGKLYALDIDQAMLDQARAEVERIGATVRGWIQGDARELERLLPERIDYVLIANTFHGVPDQQALSRGVRAVLRARGLFGIVNWHARPREQTVVLGHPRGPKTAMRMTPDAVRAVVEPAGFLFERQVELPPYHYGIVFRVAAEE